MVDADDTPPDGAPAHDSALERTAPPSRPAGQSGQSAHPVGPASYPAALNVRPISVEDTLLAAEPTPSSSGAGGSEPTLTRPGITGQENTLVGASALREQSEHPARRVDLRRDIPARIGRYLVIGPLGEGGMGVIFAAYDPQLDRKVAIKLVRPAYTESSGGEAQARLVREAQALARLRHPNIVTVYEVGAYGDEVYVAMEFVDGVTLRTWQFEHARSWREIVRVYQAAGRGLAAAHRGGLVHRDFKPDNVLVTRDGEARVLDFGLAFSDTTKPIGGHHAAALDAELTATGALVGTPAYMSPEQFSGKGVDARTDVFAFSVALYEALYGVRPYAGTTVAEICVALDEGRVSPPPPFVKIPAWLRRAVLRGLRVDPKERLQDMDAALRALGRDPARWLATASIVLVVAGVIAALVLALRSAEGQQSLRDQGARARADFDHARARALELELQRSSAGGADDRFNEFVVAAARARVSDAPIDAVATLKHLRPTGGSWAAARGVAIEALARGLPTSTWPTTAPVQVAMFADGDHTLITGDARGRIEVRARDGGGVLATSEHAGAITGLAAVRVAGDAGDRPPLRIAALAGGALLLWDVSGDTRRREGAAGSILAVALAPDGGQYVTGGADGRVRIAGWAGQALHSYPDHGSPVGAVAWSDDGSWIASGAEDGGVILWNFASDTHRTLGALPAAVRELHFEAATGLLHAVAGELAYAWSLDGAAVIVPPASVRALRVGGRARLELDPQGPVLLASADAPARTLASAAPATAIAVDSEARWVAVAHADGLELWDARARRDRSLQGPGLRLARLIWSPDGHWLAGTTGKGGLQLWHPVSGARTLLRAAGPTIQRMFFSADASTLITADEQPHLIAWDLTAEPPTARELPVINTGMGDVHARPLADGGVLQWHSLPPWASVQALAPDGERRWLSPELGDIAIAALDPGGTRLAIAPLRGAASLWRVDGATLVREPIEIGGRDHRWKAVAHASDGTHTRLAALLEASLGVATGFVVWEVRHDEVEGEPPTPHVLYEDDAAREVLTDATGEAVVVEGAAGDHLWQLASGAIDLLPACVGELHGFALAADRRRIVLVGNDRVSAVSDTACFVDLESGAYHRLRIGGEPWAWDGRRTLASVDQAADIALMVDTAPDEPAAFLAWLDGLTARALPIAHLLAPPG